MISTRNACLCVVLGVVRLEVRVCRMLLQLCSLL